MFVIFNRPDVTRTVFDKIREMKPAKLYVAADGPREGRAGERELCEQTRAIINGVDWPCDVHKLYREKNLGCGKAVSSAISWLFEHEETGIILEDDCLPNTTFFTYCETLLNKYRDDERVMMISGTSYIFDDISRQADYYFCRYYAVWGWATWRRAWQLYDFNMKRWPQLKSEHYLNYILKNSRMAQVYEEMFDALEQQHLDTWDLQWAFTCISNGGLCATASTNLIKNIGAVGTHTSDGQQAPYLKMPAVKEVSYAQLDRPVPVAVDHVHEAMAFESLITRFFGNGAAAKPSLRSRAGSIYRRLKQRLQPADNGNTFREVVTIHPANGNARGRALLSYLNDAIDVDESSPLLEGHSNKWESRTIAFLLRDMGYVVDVINWNNATFIPSQRYDVLIDISYNLQRLAAYLNGDCIKILHNTGSYWYFANAAELKRVADFEQRRHCFYSPKRLALYPELHERSLQIADHCTLIGNATTLATYPEQYRYKFATVNVSTSKTGYIKNAQELVPPGREFLWFNSFGMVHKGLDLLMEIFLKHPEWKLHIVGSNEPDFTAAFSNDLRSASNIRFHGFMNPNGAEFEALVKRCFCFISPSCSEGMSGSNATCLQIGLYPIISANSGIDLGANTGIVLQSCAIAEIEKAIGETFVKTDQQLSNDIWQLQQMAFKRFSREQFKDTYHRFLTGILQQQPLKH